MMMPWFRRAAFALALLPLLAACAPQPGNDDVNVTELVRVAPSDFRVRSFVPRGLSDNGAAMFRWVILNPGVEAGDSIEVYELVAKGSTVTAPDGSSQTLFGLKSKDYSRFQNQQVLQRAQLLSGFVRGGVAAVPDICDVAGIPVGDGWVYSVISNQKTDTVITTVRIDVPARTLERGVRFCV